MLPAGEGMAFYRWVLPRRQGLSVYLTLDSPERTDIAHLLVSDPRQQVEPVASITMRTLAEVDAAIETIERQWKDGDN